MATSGNFLTSDSGQGGNGYYSRMIFEWWETGRGISGNVGYHNIAYHLKTWDGTTTRYQQFSNGSMNVDGQGYSFGSTRAYGGGATVFGDYGKTLYTDTNGNRSFSASAQGGIYTNNINTSGSGSWGLDNIPLHATLSAISTDQGVTAYDEGPLWVEFNNPANTPVDAFIELPDGNNRVYTSASGIGSRFNFPFDAGLIAKFQQATVNSNSFTVRYGIHDSNGGDNYDYRDRTYYIKNDTGQANPTFATFSFFDGNTKTSNLLGNSNYIIQNQSDLIVSVAGADRALPKKYANMDHYTVNIGGYSNNMAYNSSSTASSAIDVGNVYDVNGVQNISVTAVDSRGNGKLVTRPVTILPYARPTINAVASRANGYDDAVVLKINGVIAPLTIGSTDKNVVDASNGFLYRFVADGGDITNANWNAVSSTQTAGTGAVAANNQGIIIAAQGTASSQHSFTIQVMMRDSLYNGDTNYPAQTATVNVSPGIPIFRIGLNDKKLYNNESQILTAGNITTALGAPAWVDLSTSFPPNRWDKYDTGATPTSDASTDTWRGPRAYKDAMGIVHLDGLVKATATNNSQTIICLLPQGMRPGHTLLEPTVYIDKLGRIDIRVNGAVSLGGSTNMVSGDWVSLNGITFYAEQ